MGYNFSKLILITHTGGRAVFPYPICTLVLEMFIKMVQFREFDNSGCSRPYYRSKPIVDL